MTISGRLGLAFALLLAVMVGFAVHVQQTVNSVDREFRIYEESSRRYVDQALRFERRVLYAALSLRNYIAFPSDEYRLRMDNAINGSYESLDEIERATRNLTPDAPSPDALRATLDGYFAVARRYAALALAGQAESEIEQELTQNRERMLASVRHLVASLENHAGAHLTTVQRQLNGMSEQVRITAIFALLLFAALGYLVVRSIRRPIRRLVDTAARWQAGDYQPALALQHDDSETARGSSQELRVLAAALGKAAQAVQLREQRLAADSDLCAQMMTSLDAAELGNVALRNIVEHLGAAGALLYRWNEADARLTALASHVLTASEQTLEAGEGLPGAAAQQREPVVLNGLPADPSLTIKLGFDQVLPSYAAAVPVLFSGHLLGVLLVASLRPLDTEGMAFLQSAAQLLALGLRNSASYERVLTLLDEVSERNEEIQRANESIQAQNEEIQAQHEELQAQNEEVQAQNEEIQAQHEELQARNSRLAELSDTLRSHAEEIEAADRRKSEFLATLAHELRNPMAPISTSVALLRRICPQNPNSDTALATIERQSSHLTRLIEDLLDITRISRGKIELQRTAVDICTLVEDCVQDHRPVLEDKGLEIEVRRPSSPVMVNIDSDRITQVVGNLLHNALKFTERGGRILIEVERRPDEVLVAVTDTGIGIEKDMLAGLFQPFSQGPSGLDRRHGGLGLGLALVKGLIEQHGGRIEARSEGANTGSRFEMSLPTFEGEPSACAETETVRPIARILVVDDNVDAARMLQLALEWEGYTVSVVHDGLSILASADEFRPDVVLCDIGLPGVNGYEVARQLRGSSTHAKTILVAITGYASENDRDLARAAGFDLHLAKPVDFERLHDVLRRIQARQQSG